MMFNVKARNLFSSKKLWIGYKATFGKIIEQNFQIFSIRIISWNDKNDI